MWLSPTLSDELVAVTQGRVRFDEPMRLHTTLHVGGPAQVWVEPADSNELAQVLKVAREADLPVTVIGAGANLLVRDEGIPGVVVHLGSPGFQGFQRSGEEITAGAGLPLEWLIRRSLDAGLSGVEFLAGVPGRVGGAVRMNAGTHDDAGATHSFSDVVRSVTVMDLGGNVHTLDREEVGFGYRTSRLLGRIVLEAHLNLIPDDGNAISQRIKRLWEFKRQTQDWSAPSAGCIFKNPKGHPAAGWLIEQVGLKGHRVGGAAISRVHANFMMNLGQAKAADLFNLIEESRARVRRQFGVELEMEVQVLP